MFEQKLIYLLGLAFVVAACANSRDRNSAVAMNAPSNDTSPSRVQNVMSSPDVSLRIVLRTTESLSMELRNNSDHPIFVSYVPLEEGSKTSFLSYSLQRKTPEAADFRQYDEGFHHVPNLHPIKSHNAVTFSLVQYPKKAGEYRVRVGYYDDESVYRMISERLTEMNDTERRRADENRRYVFSEPFLTSSERRKK
jgi:hypothetical protein